MSFARLSEAQNDVMLLLQVMKDSLLAGERCESAEVLDDLIQTLRADMAEVAAMSEKKGGTTP